LEKTKVLKAELDDENLSEILDRSVNELKEDELPAIFDRACPNCDWRISSYRLNKGLACTECIEEQSLANGFNSENVQIKLGKILEGRKELRKFRFAYNVERELQDFLNFFKKLLGTKPWGAQRVWSRRVLSGQSFAIIAPTGVGKTVFGIIMALYLAYKKNKTSYIVLPTRTLLKQVSEKLKIWEEKLGGNYVLEYIPQASKKVKEQFRQRLLNGDFKVLVTTSQFLIRNLKDVLEAFKKAKKKNTTSKFVDFMFVDDVDSFLRNPKNLDRALTLLGYMQNKKIREIIERMRRETGFGKGYAAFRLSDNERKLIVKARANSGSFVVSSATGQVKGLLVRRIFSTIFGFTIGSSKEGIRNVVDIYDPSVIHDSITNEALIDKTVHYIKKLGSGGLIFIARGPKSDDMLQMLVKKLEEEKIKALGVSIETGSKVAEVIKKFANKEVDILVGKASPYGLLVRGLDLPERVRYAIFLDVPKFSIRVELRPNPLYLTFILRKMQSIIPPEENLKEHIQNLVSQMIWLSPREIKEIEIRIREMLQNKSLDKLIAELKNVENEGSAQEKTVFYTLILYKILNNLLKQNLELLLKESNIPYEIRTENGSRSIFLLSADIKTYIQASGRTSRLYAGGITKGLALILCSNKKLVEELDRKLIWTVESPLKPLSDVNLEELIKEIDADRKKVLSARAGEMPAREHLQTCLFIVESPTKAKTIASFFGRPTKRVLPGLAAYEIIIGGYLATIVATIGHLTDIITHRFIPEFYIARRDGKMEYTVRNYKIKELIWPYGVYTIKSNGKRKFVPLFGPKVTCSKCGYTFIPYLTVDVTQGNIIKKKASRIKFFLRSLYMKESGIFSGFFYQNPLPLKCPRCGETEKFYDKHRIIETLRNLALENEVVLIGTDPDYEGEKIAWDINALLKPYAKKILRVEFHEVTRSAIEKALANPRKIDLKLVEGQFIRRIEDRLIGFYLSEELREILGERNISAGRVQSPVLSWIIDRYNRWRIKEDWTIIKMPNGIELKVKGKIEPKEVIIEKIETYEKKLMPPAPLVTDMLLTLTSTLYGMSSNETMKEAQRLFELGLVTYIRTDSTRVSDAGLWVGKRLVEDLFGSNLHVTRRWERGGEGAHECIRPTRPLTLEDLKEAIESGEIVLQEELSGKALNIYDLILRVFIASQMKEVIGTFANITFRIVDEESKKDLLVEVSGLVEYDREGFPLALTSFMRKILLPKRIPLVRPGERYSKAEIKVNYEKVPSAWPLTEGEIVRLMREKGIGRPSTYATIIQKLFERRYVRRIQHGRIVPKKRGIIVNRIIEALHKDMVSEERTRIIHEEIDEVASGKKDYADVINEIFEEINQDRKSKRTIPPELRNEIEKYKRDLERYRD